MTARALGPPNSEQACRDLWPRWSMPLGCGQPASDVRPVDDIPDGLHEVCSQVAVLEVYDCEGAGPEQSVAAEAVFWLAAPHASLFRSGIDCLRGSPYVDGARRMRTVTP